MSEQSAADVAAISALQTTDPTHLATQLRQIALLAQAGAMAMGGEYDEVAVGCLEIWRIARVLLGETVETTPST